MKRATSRRLRAASRRLRPALLGGGVFALAVALVRWQLARLFTEQAAYDVERRVGPVEIRRYPAMVVAQTTVAGTTWRDALSEGFRRLAGYIFGRGAPAAEPIAMTAPVLATAEGDAQKVQFVMPRGETQESLRAPRDPRVELRTVPPRRIAALRFRGRYDARLVKAKQRELLDALRAAGLPTRGEVTFAGYDPPWTLPALRRVEAWVDLAEAPPS